MQSNDGFGSFDGPVAATDSRADRAARVVFGAAGEVEPGRRKRERQT